MASDDGRVDRALEALAGPLAAFRSAVTEAAEAARAILAARRAPGDDSGARAAGELGTFAAGRIDAARFAALFERDEVLDPAAGAALERAAVVLSEIASSGGSAHRAATSPGGDLRDAALSALARLGRVFGAARVVELARTGRFRAAEHEVGLTALRPSRWSRAERRLAPPLVIEVDGADLKAGALADFLDGAQKIVLVVRGAAPPAPLVRLVTPGVFVLQTPDPAELEALARTEGPGIAALMPEGAARFVHDPARGATLAERLVVTTLPAEEPRTPLGGYSAAQQTEEVRQLAALAGAGVARPPVAVPAPDGAAGLPPADPADRLAAWLLARAELDVTAGAAPAAPGGNGGPR